jgi:hypothetical protein
MAVIVVGWRRLAVPGSLFGGENKRRILFACALALVLPMPAVAGPKEDALQVLERFKKAFDAADMQTVASPRSSNDRRGPAQRTIETSSNRATDTHAAQVPQYHSPAARLDHFVYPKCSDPILGVALCYSVLLHDLTFCTLRSS